MAIPTGTQVPHFEVMTVDGTRVRYADLWQRRGLVLVVLADSTAEAARAYAEALRHRAPLFTAQQTSLVVTAEPVLDGGQSTVVVADRWGEIVYAMSVHPGSEEALPSADELVEWVTFTRMQCPECPPGISGW